MRKGREHGLQQQTKWSKSNGAWVPANVGFLFPFEREATVCVLGVHPRVTLMPNKIQLLRNSCAQLQRSTFFFAFSPTEHAYHTHPPILLRTRIFGHFSPWHGFLLLLGGARNVSLFPGFCHCCPLRIPSPHQSMKLDKVHPFA